MRTKEKKSVKHKKKQKLDGVFAAHFDDEGKHSSEQSIATKVNRFLAVGTSLFSLMEQWKYLCGEWQTWK